MQKILPPGIWDNPTPEEQQAYQEFVEVWSADDSEFNKYYQGYIERNSGQTVRMLSYGADCTGQDAWDSPHVCLEYKLRSIWVLNTQGANPYYDYYNNHHLEIFPVGETLSTNDGWWSRDPEDGWLRNTDSAVAVGQDDFTVFFNAKLAGAGSVGTDEWEFGLQADGTAYQLYFSSNTNATVTSRSFDFTSEDVGAFAVVKTYDKVYLFQYEGKIGQSFNIQSARDCGDLDSSIDNGTYFEVDPGDGIGNIVVWDRALDDIEIGNLMANFNGEGQITNHTTIPKSFCFDYSLVDSGQNDNEYNHYGLGADGTADEEYIEDTDTWNETMDGGAEGGGDADESFNDSETMDGGVFGGGESGNTLNDFKTMDGGVEVDGTAFEEHIEDEAVFNHTMDGGILGGGDADETFNDSEIMDGGVEAGGEAGEEYIPDTDVWNETMDGGVLVGGNADETFNDSEIMDGGVLVGGSAPETYFGDCSDFCNILPACVAEDLVAMWEFDDTTDKYKDDYTGTHNGSIDTGFSAPVQVSGLIGKAMDFTSETDETAMITVDDHPDLSLGNMTIAFWFKRDSGDTSFSWTYLQKGENGSTEYKIRFNGTDFWFLIGDDVQYVTSASHGTYDWDKWHLVVARRYGNDMGIYIRTEDKISHDCTSYDVWSQPIAGERDLYIGNAGSYFDQFIGIMDEIVIWDRSLADSEVEWLWGDGTAAQGRRMSDYLCTYGGVEVGGTSNEWVVESDIFDIDTGLHVAFPVPVRPAQNQKPNCAVNPNSPQSKGLVGWWVNSYTDGKFVYDLAGGADGTLDDNDLWVVDPERGHVLDFDGSSEIDIPYSPLLNVSAYSVSGWLNVDQIDDFHMILARGDSSGDDIEIYIESLQFTVHHNNNGTNPAKVQFVPWPAASKWIHFLVAFSPDLTDGWRLYYDGVSQVANSIVGTNAPESTSTRGWKIGNTPYTGWSGADPHLHGKIFDIRVYNRIVGQDEAQQIYNAQTRYDLWYELENSDLVIISEEVGVVVGGEADEEHIATDVYNETMDGGVLVNGSANVTDTYNETMDGGVLVNSSADETFNDSETMDGGVLAGGAAEEFVEGEYNEVMDGGAEVPQGSAEYPRELTIVNPGAETGDMTGWNHTDMVVKTSGRSGSYRFVGGDVANCSAWQDISVPTDMTSQIDNGEIMFKFSGWRNGFSGDSDRGRITITYLDGTDSTIGTKLYHQYEWASSGYQEQVLTNVAPSGARKVRIGFEGTRTGGSECSVYYDDFTLFALKKEQELTVTNGDAETGDTTGWTMVTGTLSSVTSRGGVSPSFGSRFFWGGDGATTEHYQEVSLPSELEVDIDSGIMSAVVSGQFAGYTDNDTGTISVTFYDSTSGSLGTTEPHYTDGMSIWGQRSVYVSVPAEARTLRITIKGDRNTGTACDCYFDEIQAYLTKSESDSKSIIQAEYNPDSAGGLLGGTSADVAQAYGVIASGGVLVNGEAHEYTNEIMDGGALVGGSAEEDFNDTEIMDGGVVVSGEAEESMEGEYNEVMDGGVLAGGSVDRNAVYNPEANYPVSNIGIPIPAPAHQPNTRPNCEMDVLNPQADGLIAWWTGQNHHNEIIHDKTHRGADLTAESGATTLQDDERGWVFNFDGTDQVLERDSLGPFADKSIPFTHSAWFKTDSADWDGTQARMVFICRNEIEPTSTSYVWIQFYNNSLEYGCRTGNNIARAQDLTNSWDDGEWHLAVGVSYSLTDHRLFVDGVQVASTTDSCNQSPTLTRLFRIGNDGGGTYNAEFPGQIDDVRIYNRAFSEEQIQHLWNPQTRYSLWLVPERNTVVVGGGIDVVVGGAADENIDEAGEYNETMDGGVVVNGDALIPDGVRITQVDAEPVYLDGRLRVSQVDAEPVYLDGRLRISQVDVEPVYDEGRLRMSQVVAEVVYSAPSGGVVVGGEADEEKLGSFDEIMDGGVVVNGSSEEDFNDSEIMDGGVVVGGEADENLGGTIEMDGGVVVNGTATEFFVEFLDGTGGVVVNGSADEDYIPGSQTYDETMDGGVVVGGEIKFIFNEISEGGVVVNGRTKLTYDETTEGGIVGGGGEDYFAIYNPDLGPYQWLFPAVYDQVSEQELIDNGNPPPHDNEIWCYIQLDIVNNRIHWHFTHDYPNLDTIRFRGPAEPGELGFTQIKVEEEQWPTPLTSPVIGSADITEAQKLDIIDGYWYVFAREAEDEYDVMRGQIVPYQPTVVGGEASFTEDDSLEFGGVEVGGAIATVDFIENTGGVVIGGKAIVEEEGEYYEVGEGGVVAGGDSLWQQDGHYFEIPEGGVVVNGIAFWDHWENTCRCLPTSRVLSLNELNFLDQQIFIQEMVNKTQMSAIVWDSMRVLIQFKAGDGPFEYRLTQTQFGITLDVLKDGKFFGNFSSEVHPEIRELFDDVVIMVKDDKRMKDTLATVDRITGCRDVE